MVEWNHPSVVYLMSGNWDSVAELRRARPRNWPARISAALLLVLGIGSWIVGDFGVTAMFSERRLTNLGNFLGEIWPYPLQSTTFDTRVFIEWSSDLMRTRGLEAAITTLAISIAAIFIAGCGGAVLSFMGARTLVTASPYLPSLGATSRLGNGLWSGTVAASRLLMIFARSIPEYVWAFLFLAMLGPVAWPLVLALALHNSGILGRLGAEVVENTESRRRWLHSGPWVRHELKWCSRRFSRSLFHASCCSSFTAGRPVCGRPQFSGCWGFPRWASGFRMRAHATSTTKCSS